MVRLACRPCGRVATAGCFGRFRDARGGILRSLLTEQPAAAIVLKPEALAFDIDGAGMVEQAVEDGGGQHLLAEYFTPVDEALVGSDDEAGALVATGDQPKEEIRVLAGC